MAKKTLLELVQYILSSLDSDEVNSINDTVESQQVAKLVETAYFDLVARSGFTEHYDFFELEAANNPETPTIMYRPSRIRSVEWLKYQGEDGFKIIKFITPREMMDLTQNFNTADEETVGSFSLDIGGDDIEFFYKKDSAPHFYTTFDDRTFLFDSYNADDEDTLQKGNTLGYGEVAPSFEMQDDFTPDLDEKQFPMLLNAAKVLAFAELKQTSHAVAGGNLRKQWIASRREKSVIPSKPFYSFPNYGRRAR